VVKRTVPTVAAGSADWTSVSLRTSPERSSASAVLVGAALIWASSAAIWPFSSSALAWSAFCFSWIAAFCFSVRKSSTVVAKVLAIRAARWGFLSVAVMSTVPSSRLPSAVTLAASSAGVPS
jgi:hypothetical protein